MTWGSKLCNQPQTQQQRSHFFPPCFFKRTELMTPHEGVGFILPEEAAKLMWLFSAVSRHHLGMKQRSELLLLFLLLLEKTCLNSDFTQRAGKWNKHVPVLTDTSETLGQSSPQLFHFADFLRGLGGWHQVAHFFFPHRQRTVSGQTVIRSVWRRTGGQSAQLQRAGKQETEPQRLSLLSSTSAANVFWRCFSRILTTFQKMR